MSDVCEELPLRRPVRRQRQAYEVLKGQVGGLRTVDDGSLQIGREEGQPDQPTTILGLGCLLAYGEVTSVELDHLMGALKRTDENRIAPDSGDRARADLGVTATIAHAQSTHEPQR